MKKKLWLLLAVIVAAMVFTTACVTDEDEDQQGEKVYRASWTGDLTSLNAHANVSTLVSDLYVFVHSGLFQRVPGADRMSSMIVPDIAAAPPIQIDEWTWHIPIREEARWHNGTPIDAHTLEFSYRMLLCPVLRNPMSNFMFAGAIDIANGRDFFVQGQEGNDPVDWADVGITAIEDHLLEIRTIQRWTQEDVMRHFLDRSTFPVYPELYEYLICDCCGEESMYGTSLDTIMFAGPFFFDTWVQDALHIYTRNHDHWMTEWFHFDRVEIRIVPDRNARVQLWEQGELDLLGLDAVLLPIWRFDPRVRSAPTVSPIHIDINCRNYENPLLSNRYFRRALLFAMDRVTIADLAGGQRPAPYYVNYDAMAGTIQFRSTPEARANELPNYGFNPELALEYFEKALADVGVESGWVRMSFGETHATYTLIAQFLEQELPAIFGADRFEVRLDPTPPGWARDYVNNPTQYELHFVSWGSTASRVMPFRAFEFVVSTYPEPMRPAPIIIPEFDEVYYRAATEEARLNPQLMIELTAELERLHMYHVMQVVLYQGRSHTLHSNRLILPVDQHVPALGWGVRFADIDLSR